jgi:hypothetical protein
MARNRRAIQFFSLSFLDVMSCGFGAVLLLFLVIKHRGTEPVQAATIDNTSEVRLLEEDIATGREQLVVLRNTIAEVEQERVITEGLAREIQEKVEETAGTKPDASAVARVRQLEEEVRQLQAEKEKIESDAQKKSDAARVVQGEGQREYLTGIRLSGQRTLILFDVSASMLDDTIVNIVRKRNMEDSVKRRAPKWRQALATVDWLTARLPRGGQYQLYTFNTTLQAALPGTAGRWLDVGNRKELDDAVDAVKKLVPQGGTSLEAAFGAVGRMTPPPDNVVLVTDGLPTQGGGPPRGATVSGKEREKLFAAAVRQLPRRMAPMNIILLPMEGDPIAAGAYWRLALETGGSFFAPSPDWP